MSQPQSPTNSNRLPTLECMPGVGTNKLGLLAKLGVRRSVDLLFLFPRSYQEIADTKTADQLERDVRCSVVGVVEAVDFRAFPSGGSQLGALLEIPGGFVRLVFYNQDFRRHQLNRGTRVIATGVPKPTGVSWEMRHPEVVVLAADEEPPANRPRPVYPLTEGLKQHHVAKMVDGALEQLLPTIREALPDDFREQFDLLRIDVALKQIHQPETLEQAETARYRFVFQELLAYQLALQVRRYRLQHSGIAPELPANGKINARILRRFGFPLTGDQQTAIEDIANDLSLPTPMNRLVQGDVGSGKTVVALYAMLLAVAHGYQAALMAPTESLARQHFSRLSESLKGSDVHVDFLAGTIGGRNRSELLERIALGTVDIVIGTQALLSERVEFDRLALVVIDEQHKFGVGQRAALKDDTKQPHYLMLSATPIPRTLTMTVFGDLDVSILREKPAGRADVHTYLGKRDQEASWWQFVRKKIDEGRQSFVVCPRVEQTAEEDVAGAEQTFERLRTGPLSDLKIDLLHGRIDSQRAAEVLGRFESGETQVLVATTIVEVGIDVPNATVMTIFDANRLGLSQLHQLRGRISRSSHPGYLCVFASAGVEAEEHDRLNALASTTDGFKLSEMDLQLRGPGNLLGTTQHGLPPFRIADLVRDAQIVITARDAAKQIIAADPELSSETWSGLHGQVFIRHGNMLDFGNVG